MNDAPELLLQHLRELKESLLQPDARTSKQLGALLALAPPKTLRGASIP